MVKIIVDSSTLYSKSEGKALSFDVVPLSVTINNQSYREFEEINDVEFLEIIQKGHIPSSSQPPVGEFLDLFENYRDDQVLVIAMADGLSGTYQSVMGAKAISDNPNIVVINSKTLCVPHRYLLEDALELRDKGESFENIIAKIEETLETSHSYLLPQDFGYLKRGGRLTTVAATLGGLLKIQPILIQTPDGTRLDNMGVGRNFRQAINKVIAHMESLGHDKSSRFSVTHAFVLEQAEYVAQRIKDRFNVEHVEIMPLSCAFITQGGPMCIAIQVINR